jgi:G:T-mismatch repair DNA endonuclease (very short patch repair protein)
MRNGSKLEDRIFARLVRAGLSVTRQARLNFYAVDFLVNGAIYLEVNGCYWHGCPTCFPVLTKRQRARRTRDRRLASYCRRRRIPLVTIWEHEIRHGDFSSLRRLGYP